MSKALYDNVTKTIVEAIENVDENDWAMPWDRKAAMAMTMPANLKTMKAYRGINVLLLWASAAKNGFGSNIWATMKQWNEKGYKIKKGSASTWIVFFKPYKKEEEDDNGDTVVRQGMVARGYKVFNGDQVEDFEGIEIGNGDNLATLDHVEDYVANTEAKIVTADGAAFYSPMGDIINMPPKETFKDTEGYYSTMLHELTHWTGAKHRLDRLGNSQFGDASYAFEELVAELGAAFQCAKLGITKEPREDHAKYLKGWLKKLKEDNYAIFRAASAAQAAADYLDDLQTETNEEDTEAA